MCPLGSWWLMDVWLWHVMAIKYRGDVLWTSEIGWLWTGVVEFEWLGRWMLPLSPFHQPTNWTRFLFVSLGSAVALYAGGCTGAKQQMRPGGVDPSISQLFITFTPQIQDNSITTSWLFLFHHMFFTCFSGLFKTSTIHHPINIHRWGPAAWLSKVRQWTFSTVPLALLRGDFDVPALLDELERCGCCAGCYQGELTGYGEHPINCI